MKVNKRIIISILLVLAISVSVIGAALAGGGEAPKCRTATEIAERIYTIVCRDSDANLVDMEITQYFPELEGTIIYSKGNDYRWSIVFNNFACFDYVLIDSDGQTYEGAFYGKDGFDTTDCVGDVLP